MQLFISVAKLASFSRAAEILGISRGSVSRQIQALENRAGVRLLHRTTRRVQLTSDGQIYYEHCRDLLERVTELDELFHHDPATISGRIRVDMPADIARHMVMPRLSEFMAHYPAVALELGCSDRQIDLIQEGYDCAVWVGTPGNPTLAARSLGKLTLINCASRDYLARFGCPENLEALRDHAMVHHSDNFGTAVQGFVYQENGVAKWIKIGGGLTVNTTQNYLAAALAGLGIIQVTRIAVKEALSKGELIEILPQYRPPPVAVSLLYPNRRNLSRRVCVFIKWLAGLTRHYVD